VTTAVTVLFSVCPDCVEHSCRQPCLLTLHQPVTLKPDLPEAPVADHSVLRPASQRTSSSTSTLTLSAALTYRSA
jgi:hypothetical protein